MNSQLVEKGCKVISARIPGMAKQFDLQGFTQHIQALPPPSPWSRRGRDETPSPPTATASPSPPQPPPACPALPAFLKSQDPAIASPRMCCSSSPGRARPQEEALGRNVAILKQDSYLDDLPSSPFPGLLSSAIIQQG